MLELDWSAGLYWPKLSNDVLAAEYTKNAQLGASKHAVAPNMAEHCKYNAEHCRNAAKEMRAMAAAYEELASSLTK